MIDQIPAVRNINYKMQAPPESNWRDQSFNDSRLSEL